MFILLIITTTRLLDDIIFLQPRVVTINGIVIYCVELNKSIKTQTKSVKGRGIYKDKSSLISSSMTRESHKEFHNLMVEGRKEFTYASVLANRIVKCWLCQWVDDIRGVRVIVMSTRQCNILQNRSSFT